MTLFKKISKLYLPLLIFVLVLLAVMLPLCGSGIMHPLNLSQIAYCPVEQLSQAASHLAYFKQLLQALPGQVNILYLLALVILTINIYSLAQLSSSSLFFQYWRRQFIFHMKPWDPLRLALAQGIIHNKHLD